MKWGNHGPQKDSRAVNWFDVSSLIQVLEKTYGGHVQVLFDCEGCRNASGALWVRAMAFRGWDTQGERPIDVVAKQWPSRANNTMAGMVFQALHLSDPAPGARRRAESEE